MKPFYIFSILLFCFVEYSHSNTYYISNSGDDNNSGDSPSLAWATIGKVNSVSFNPGDFILFNRGDKWFGQLIPQSGSSSGHITYGAYGSGNKPLLHMSVEKNSISDWTEENPNIWVASILSTDVGNIIFNNESSVGIKVANQSDLNQQGEFCYDGVSDSLSLYSTQNPASYYSDIRCILHDHIIEQSNKSYIIYEDLALKYGGSHAIGGINTHHIIVRNLDISFMGGCYISDSGGNTYRYGNGVEFWGGAHDNLVEGCYITEIYDAAVSNQSDVPGNQYNITYKNNVIWDCEYSFEFWHFYAGSTMQNIQFINNTCLNAGYGWSHNQRNDPSGRHISCSEITANISGIVIENNIFRTAKHSLIYLPDNDYDVHLQLLMDYNCLYQTTGLIAEIEINLVVHDYTSGEFDNYQSESGFDQNSIFVNPLLSGFNLTENSECIDAGNPSYPLDPDGTIADIGALYFYHTVVVEPVDTTEYISICQGEDYNGWTESGEYERTLVSSLGGDSIVTTFLTVNPVYNIEEDTTIFEGDNYNGWTTTGVYQRTLETVDGCDSVVTTNLTVILNVYTTEYISICDGDNYLGRTTTDTFDRTLPASVGSDSIVTTYLSVLPTYNVVENTTIFEGEDYNGWTTTGVYHRTLATVDGCDSVVTTNLTVILNIYTTEYISICEGENYNGWTSSGEYERILQASIGSDSIITTFLTVNPVYNIEEDTIIFEGEDYNGWTTTGVYQRTLETVDGCDSVVTTHLTMALNAYTNEYISICEGDNYNGWTSEGVYVRVLETSLGADSTITTYLTVNPVYRIQEDITIYEGEDYFNWTNTGIYRRTLDSDAGCDSIVTTKLTVIPNIYTTEYVAICDGDNYIGRTTTDTFVRTLQSSVGSDSIVTTYLSVLPTYLVEQDTTIKEGEDYYSWTVTGRYERTLESVSGCDSFVIINLTVLEKVYSSEEISICEGENYNGWTSTGQYERILESSLGGDSIITTFLTVNSNYYIEEDTTISKGESYNDWTDPGEYQRILNTTTGCDSIIITNLNVVINTTEEVSICEGEEYHEWTESGEYERSFVTDSGYDSIIVTNLIVNPIYEIIENIEIEEGEDYFGWTVEGQYQRDLNSVTGCDSIVITNLTIIDSSSVGIDYLYENLKLNVYPNPASSWVTIKFSQVPSPGTVIQLFDMTGRLIQRKEAQAVSVNLNIEMQPSGLYVIKTITGDKFVTNKLIIR